MSSSSRVAARAAACVVCACALAIACGRSAQPNVVCPAPADECDELRAQQAELEATFAAAVDDDGDVAREAAECVALFVDVGFDKGCAEPCAELCRLHPCASPDDVDCAAACFGAGVDVSAVEAAAVRAAETPGVCTCDVCGDVKAVCDASFVCP